MEFNLGKEIGATEEPSAQRLTLYIPNKDCVGGLIDDHEKWTNEAQGLLTEIGGGATAFPPVDGTWRKPDGSDLWEQTTIIYTYVDQTSWRQTCRDYGHFCIDLEERRIKAKWYLSSMVGSGAWTSTTRARKSSHGREDQYRRRQAQEDRGR